MYSYTKRVGYSECDSSLHLSYFELVNLFQDAAILEGENKSVTIKELYADNLAWLLGSWQICINRMPGLNEEIEIATIPYEFKGFLGYRNFTLKTTEGELLAYAYAIWSLIDVKTMKPARVSEELKSRYPIAERIEMDYKPRRINLIGEGKICDAVKIRKMQIDSNNHVNNAEYVNIALEYLPMNTVLKEIRVEYKNAAYLDSKVVPVIYENDGCLQIDLKGENETFAIVELSF